MSGWEVISPSGQTLEFKIVVACSVMFHINGYHNDRPALCLYTVMGRDVCSIAIPSVSTMNGQSSDAKVRTGPQSA